MKDRIHIEGISIEELLYLRIKRLTSTTLCRNVIKRQKPDLTPEVLNSKAEGLSSSINSFLGFFNFENKTKSLNLWILTRYYALLQITIAEQLVQRDEISSLEDIEQSTKYGHGINACYTTGHNILDDFKLYLRPRGYLSDYLSYLGFDVAGLTSEHSIRSDDLTNSKLFSLEELFLRIPEMRAYKDEYFSKPFYVLHTIYDGMKNRSPSIFSEKKEELKTKTTYIMIPAPIPEDLQNYTIPFKNVEIRESEDNQSDDDLYYSCYIEHETEYVWQSLKTYKTAYSATSFIVPLKNTVDDAVAINLMLLYGLSIIVRYYPSIWNKIEHSEYNDTRSLIEYYLTIFDKIILELMIEKIEGKKPLIAITGGFNSSI